MKLRLKLVANWKSCWRWFSTQSMVAAAALTAAWVALPQDLVVHISEEIRTGLVVGILALGVLGRLVDQEDSE